MLGKAPFQPISGNSLYTITSRFSLMVAAWFITCWVLLHDAATLVAAQGNVDRLIAGLILSSRRIVWGFGACLVVFAFVHVLLTWTAFRKRSKMSLSQLKRDQREQLGAPEILTARKQHLIDLTHTDPERLLRYTNLLVDDGASTTTLLAYDPAVDIAPRLLKTVRGIDRERLLAVASSLTVPVVKSEWLAARLASASPLAPLPQELHSALAEAYAAPVKTN
jgi:type III secretory pathway component EscU